VCLSNWISPASMEPERIQKLWTSTSCGRNYTPKNRDAEQDTKGSINNLKFIFGDFSGHEVCLLLVRSEKEKYWGHCLSIVLLPLPPTFSALPPFWPFCLWPQNLFHFQLASAVVYVRSSISFGGVVVLQQRKQQKLCQRRLPKWFNEFSLCPAICWGQDFGFGRFVCPGILVIFYAAHGIMIKGI